MFCLVSPLEITHDILAVCRLTQKGMTQEEIVMPRYVLLDPHLMVSVTSRSVQRLGL